MKVYSVSGRVAFEGDELLSVSVDLGEAINTAILELQKRYVTFDRIIVSAWDSGVEIKTLDLYQERDDGKLYFRKDFSEYTLNELMERMK